MEKPVKKPHDIIERYGIPGGDLYDIPTSGATFPDGAHYRMEISGIDSLAEMEALIDEKTKRGVPIHRVIAIGNGAYLLTSSELKELAQMGAEAKIEVISFPGREPITISANTPTHPGGDIRESACGERMVSVTFSRMCCAVSMPGFAVSSSMGRIWVTDIQRYFHMVSRIGSKLMK